MDERKSSPDCPVSTTMHVTLTKTKCAITYQKVQGRQGAFLPAPQANHLSVMSHRHSSFLIEISSFLLASRDDLSIFASSICYWERYLAKTDIAPRMNGQYLFEFPFRCHVRIWNINKVNVNRMPTELCIMFKIICRKSRLRNSN